MYGEQICALAGLVDSTIVRGRRGSFSILDDFTVCASLILHARAHGRPQVSLFELLSLLEW